MKDHDLRSAAEPLKGALALATFARSRETRLILVEHVSSFDGETRLMFFYVDPWGRPLSPACSSRADGFDALAPGRILQDEAREALAAGHPLWARPMILSVLEEAPDQALVRVAEAVLAVFALPGVEARDAGLVRELLAVVEKGEVTPADLYARSEAIWCAPGGRDPCRTAVSNLWAAPASKPSAGSKHALTLCSVLANLISGTPEPVRSEAFEAIAKALAGPEPPSCA